MMNNIMNSVYKCERCGNLFADRDLMDDGDIEKFNKHAYLVRHRSDGHVCLCPECLEALTEFMQRTNKATDDQDVCERAAQLLAKKWSHKLAKVFGEALSKADTDGD